MFLYVCIFWGYRRNRRLGECCAGSFFSSWKPWRMQKREKENATWCHLEEECRRSRERGRWDCHEAKPKALPAMWLCPCHTMSIHVLCVLVQQRSTTAWWLTWIRTWTPETDCYHWLTLVHLAFSCPQTSQERKDQVFAAVPGHHSQTLGKILVSFGRWTACCAERESVIIVDDVSFEHVQYFALSTLLPRRFPWKDLQTDIFTRAYGKFCKKICEQSAQLSDSVYCSGSPFWTNCCQRASPNWRSSQEASLKVWTHVESCFKDSQWVKPVWTRHEHFHKIKS